MKTDLKDVVNKMINIVKPNDKDFILDKIPKNDYKRTVLELAEYCVSRKN